MTSESDTQIPRRPWTLLLGPGLSLTQCLPVLEALAQARAEAPAALEQLEDWSELFSSLEEVGRMLVDADQFGLEHLGLLKAFLKRFPGWELALMGRDAATRPLRELLRLRQIRWIPAPLDMDSMDWLLQAPNQLYGNRQLQGGPALKSGGLASETHPGNISPGNIPSGYVTRSSGPFAEWENAPLQAVPSTKPQPPAGDRNSLALYDIPRAEPNGDAPAEVGAGRRGYDSSIQAISGEPADPELNEATEKQLLAEVERILVGSTDASGATAVAIAPTKTIAPASELAPLEETTFETTVETTELEEVLQQEPEPEISELTSLQAAEETAVEVEPALDVDSELSTQALAPSKTSNPVAPAPFFKHQVADLADIVQCVDMGLDQAAEDVLSAEGAAGDRLATRFEQLCGEVARLRQYTRTLSFMASPPVPGRQTFDLAPMLEEMLTMRRSAEEAPRYLIRTPERLPLRSDKLLLTQALDALLFLCHACSGPEGTVRVDGRLVEDEACAIQVSIRFPAGQLAELEPDEILQPYALRRSLPELGPNSLAAAAGIVRGQGGEVQLVKEPRGGLEWLIRLPSA